MRYNGIEYSLENYERINKIITKIIKDAGNFHGIPITRITYKHIESYCTNFFDYKYILQEFSDNATAFLGKLIRENGQTFIMINDNKNIPFEKKTQGKMHETVHTFLHCNSFDKSQNFNMLLHNFDYSDDEKIQEVEADLGSFIFMINDYALYNCFLEMRSYNFIKEFFKISDENLKVRIKAFLIYNCGISELHAEIVIDKYRNSDISGILNCVNIQ